jgi:hypothetical protein
MDMIRQYRHIESLGRAGRGHDPLGVMATQPGEMTEPCRCCPHPGINIPDDVEKLPPNLRLVTKDSLLYSFMTLSRWIYALFTAMDANFKQKARARRNDNWDVPLGPGWGASVESTEYNTHIAQHAKGAAEEVCEPARSRDNY